VVLLLLVLLNGKEILGSNGLDGLGGYNCSSANSGIVGGISEVKFCPNAEVVFKAGTSCVFGFKESPFINDSILSSSGKILCKDDPTPTPISSISSCSLISLNILN
jgi:hypothetical protein